jgi:TonB family protein
MSTRRCTDNPTMRNLRLGATMGNNPDGRGTMTLPRAGVKLLQACALALMLALSVQGRAADDRTVKVRVAPVYPELAKRMKISGVVKIEATVDSDGKVTDVKTVAGNHLLSTAAEDAVRKWKFTSGSGTTDVNVDITFAMEK